MEGARATEAVCVTGAEEGAMVGVEGSSPALPLHRGTNHPSPAPHRRYTTPRHHPPPHCSAKGHSRCLPASKGAVCSVGWKNGQKGRLAGCDKRGCARGGAKTGHRGSSVAQVSQSAVASMERVSHPPITFSVPPLPSPSGLLFPHHPS